MKLIIAGSRDWSDWERFTLVLDALYADEVSDRLLEVVSGACPTGADAMGERWAKEWDRLPTKRFPPDESLRPKHGNGIYHMRNRQMAEYADACIVFQLGDSSGSNSMIREAKRAGISLVVVWEPRR